MLALYYGHQTSVTSGTIFQDTRKPLKTCFTAIWWLTTQKNGASAKGLRCILGLDYETAWTWLHKIRTAMVFLNRIKLNGSVKVDEAYIGGEKSEGKRGRGTKNKILVAVAVEVIEGKKTGRTRLSVITDASTASLMPFVLENVESGRTVITDGWSSHSFLSSNGYQHTKIPSKTVDSEDTLLSHAYIIISLLKRWLLGTHQGAVIDKHIQAYLDEYVFRFNRRKAAERGLLFYRLLELCHA